LKQSIPYFSRLCNVGRLPGSENSGYRGKTGLHNYGSKLILWASPDYLRQHGEPTTVEELTDHQSLRYNVAESNTFRIFDADGKAHLLKLAGRISANNGSFLRDLTIAGHGILASPAFIWQAIADGELMPILHGCLLPNPNAYLAYPKTRYLSRRARVLIDFLKERFGDKHYWDQGLFPTI